MSTAEQTPSVAKAKRSRTTSQPRYTDPKHQVGDHSDSASPLLRGRKRKSSNPSEAAAPPHKKMADNEILSAINDIGKSVVSMEKQLKQCCTKEDMTKMAREIRTEVQSNSKRIDKLFEMRKSDGAELAKKVEKIVDQRLNDRKMGGAGAMSPHEEAYQHAFLKSRRSTRLWPIPQSLNTEESVREFFYTILSVPQSISKNVKIESVERVVQPRRSKISNEVLVRFQTTHDRDTIQSYAANLAGIDGKAGLRIDVPDHLRGVFRQFEAHAALLKQKYGAVKRSIKFDDAQQSFCMDVKLETTGWHRIDHQEIRKAAALSKASQPPNDLPATGADQEKKKILMMPETPEDPIIVSDEEASE